MSVSVICGGRRLFELSERGSQAVLGRGELLSYATTTYQIVDVEHVALPDGGVDRARIETMVYVKELGEAELRARREGQVQGKACEGPIRY